MKKNFLGILGLTLLITVVLSLIFPMLSSQSVFTQSIYAAENGTCCPELGSICGLNGRIFDGYYYIKEGPCNQEA